MTLSKLLNHSGLSFPTHILGKKEKIQLCWLSSGLSCAGGSTSGKVRGKEGVSWEYCEALGQTCSCHKREGRKKKLDCCGILRKSGQNYEEVLSKKQLSEDSYVSQKGSCLCVPDKFRPWPLPKAKVCSEHPTGTCCQSPPQSTPTGILQPLPAPTPTSKVGQYI